MKKILLALAVLSATTLAHAGVVCRAESTMNAAWGEGAGFNELIAQQTAINYCLANGGFQCVVVQCNID